MRMLLLTNEYPPQKRRGTAIATSGLAQALVDRGWDVHVIVTCRDKAPKEELDGSVHLYRLSVLQIPYTRTMQRLCMIVRMASRLRPDVVQGQAASCGLFAAAVGRLLRIPSITYVQGMDFHESGAIQRALEVGPAIRYATRAIATTETLAEALRPYARCAVEAIPHGYQSERISDEVLDAAAQGMDAEAFHVLFVGFFEPDKGLDYLLSAVAQLVEEWPRLRLHLVGQGPLREEIEARATRLGIAARVRFYGEVPHDVVMGLMRRADLFVLPSLQEPYGITVTEALSEGCPVVVTDACGSAGAVEQGRDGFVVPAGNAAALADAMRTILKTPDFKRKMLRSVSARVQDLRWDRLVQRFERLYRESLNPPLRVCIVVNEYPPGRTAGTAMATQALARFLVGKGCHVFVVVTERGLNEPAVSNEDGVIIHRLWHGSVHVVRWASRVRRIRRLVGAIAPDALHGQSISCGLYAVLASWGRAIPVLACIQGYDLWESTPLKRRTEVRWALRGADRVTAVSPVLARLGEAVADLPRIDVLPHGFRPESELPERAQLRDQWHVQPTAIVLLFAGRLLPIKGVDVLLHAFKEVAEGLLWIAGGGFEGERLKELARTLGIAERVGFLGNLPHRSLAERMKAADLFVLPSRSEPFGIVLVEAMDAALPIVATEVGGIPSIVESENGLLVPPDDVAALAKAIRELMNDPARRAAMACANAVKAKAYRWETLGESYLDLYRELVAARRRP